MKSRKMQGEHKETRSERTKRRFVGDVVTEGKKTTRGREAILILHKHYQMPQRI